MKLKPNGYYVLIKVQEIDTKSAGGIELPREFVDREQGGHDEGEIVAFGPLAFTGVTGIPATHEGNTLDVHQRAALWGTAIGERVIYERYDGKDLREKTGETYRLVQDQHLICGIED